MSRVTELYDKLPEETDRAYAAFCSYRDLGPTRSLAKAAEVFYGGKTRAKVVQFENWSSTHGWVQRATVWDEEQRRQTYLRRNQEAEDARDRAVRAAQMVQAIGIRGLRELHDDVRGAALNPPLSLLRYWREGMEAEFLALGLPISVIKQEIEPPDPALEEHQERMGRYGVVVQQFQNPKQERRQNEFDYLGTDDPR